MKISEEARRAADKSVALVRSGNPSDEQLQIWFEHYHQTAINNASKPLVEALNYVYQDHFANNPPRCRICEALVRETLDTFHAEHEGVE